MHFHISFSCLYRCSSVRKQDISRIDRIILFWRLWWYFISARFPPDIDSHTLFQSLYFSFQQHAFRTTCNVTKESTLCQSNDNLEFILHLKKGWIKVLKAELYLINQPEPLTKWVLWLFTGGFRFLVLLAAFWAAEDTAASEGRKKKIINHIKGPVRRWTCETAGTCMIRHFNRLIPTNRLLPF